jgi:hypothetical protein
MKRTFRSILLAAVSVVSLSFWTSLAGGQVRDTSAQRPADDEVQAVDAISDLSPKTATEREFADYFDRDALASIPEFLQMGGGIQTAAPRFSDFPATLPTVDPKSDPYLYNVCASDAVVIGTPKSHGAFITPSQRWMFTEYDVTVTQWIQPADGSDTLTVGHSGARVKIGGAPISIVQRGMVPPVMNTGQSYVLFMRRPAGKNLHVLLFKPGDAPSGLTDQDKANMSALINRLKTLSDSCSTRR